MAGPYDVILKSQAVNPEVSLGLVFFQGELTGQPGERIEQSAWQEYRDHPLPPRRSSGQLSTNQRDPTQDLVIDQQSWVGGTSHNFLAGETITNFASSQGLETRFGSVLSLGVSLPTSATAIISSTLVAAEATKRWVGATVVNDMDGDTAYACSGRTIWRCKGSATDTYVWEDATPTATFTNADEIAALTELNGSAYAFRASPSSDIYPIRFTPGETTTILSGYGDDTDHFPTSLVKARNATGTFVLWGAVGNELRWSADLVDGWNPAAAFTVGSSSQDITGLHPFRDTFLISKTNGLWVWSQNGTVNDFVNVTSEWENAPGLERGIVGAEWHRDLFLAGSNNTFLRYDTEVLESLTELVQSVRFPDTGGRVTAMLTQPDDLIVALKPESGNARLARLRITNGVFVLHPIGEMPLVEVHQMVMLDEEVVWVLGETADGELGGVMFREPMEPAAFLSDKYSDSGRLRTLPWHGGTPDIDKACIVLSAWVDGVDQEHPITVNIRTDGGGWEQAGVFNSPAETVQYIYFNNMPLHLTNAVGKFIELEWVFEDKSATKGSPPKLYAYELHAQAFFRPIRVWQFRFAAGTDVMLNTGVFHEMTSVEIHREFNQLERQPFPCVMEWEGEMINVRIVDFARHLSAGAVEGTSSQDSAQEEVWVVTVREAYPS